MITKLQSERRRMCARHPKAQAVHLRRTVEKASAGEYQALRPECAECAVKNTRKGGTLIKV